MPEAKCRCGLLLKISGDAEHCVHCGKRLKPFVSRGKIKRRMFHEECPECPNFERKQPTLGSRCTQTTFAGHCKVDDAYLIKSLRPRRLGTYLCTVKRETEAA